MARRAKWKKFGLNLFKQLAIIGLLIWLIGLWQTRNLPSGVAPALLVKQLEGDSALSLSGESKGGVQLIYFFAPWCGVCRLSMGNLNHIQSWLPQVKVVAVGLDYENREEVQKFVQDVGIGVPVYLGDLKIQQEWNISAYPTYAIMDSHGRLLTSSMGYSSQVGMGLRLLWSIMYAKVRG